MARTEGFPAGMAEAQALLSEAIGTVDEARQRELRKLAAFDPERRARYATAETYYDGAQPKYLDDRLKTFLEVSGIPYGENFCETVVDALVERLAVIGVTCDDEHLSEWLWETWYDGNAGDVLQQQLHLEAAKKGDAYIILSWDAAKGITAAHLNSPHLIEPKYDDEANLTCVVKVWGCESTSPTLAMRQSRTSPRVNMGTS